MSRMLKSVGVIDAEFKSLRDLNPIFMATEEKAEAMKRLTDMETHAAELRLRLMASSDDVAQAEGFHSVASWLTHHTHVRRPDAAADLKLAVALDRDLAVLATAMREARVNVAQARVIAHALSELPDGIEPEVAALAEAELVRLAGEHGPADLAKLGRRILELVDPQRSEDEERRKLEDAEKAAQEKQRLKMRALGDGLTRISGVIPDAVAARLSTYLHAFTNPRLADGTARMTADQDGTDKDAQAQRGFGRPVNHPRRLAEAFGQLLETLDPSRLPLHGGDATNLTVTISLDDLKTGLGMATLDNGTPGDGFDHITAGHARRLACTAKIIPVVLGADSEVLDVGRASRLYTKAQRKALLLRDKTCRAEGCTIPGTWAEAHHLVPWSHGGATDLSNGVLLCSRHHHAHDETYDMRRLSNGALRFRRRP